VADLAAARAAQGLGFAGGIGRHIVLVHITLELFFGNVIQALLLVHRAQGCDGENLRLPAGEEAGTVRAGQETHVAPDRADLRQGAAVGTDALPEYLLAYDFFGDVIQAVADVADLIGVDGVKVRMHFLVDFILAVLALLAVKGIHRPDQFIIGVGADGFVHLGALLDDGVIAFGDAHLGHDLIDKGDDAADFIMGQEDGVEHHFLGDDLGAGFDHHDGVLGAGDGQVQKALIPLRAVGVEDILPVDIAHVDRGGGAHEGDVGDGKGHGRADHGIDIRGDFGVHG